MEIVLNQLVDNRKRAMANIKTIRALYEKINKTEQNRSIYVADTVPLSPSFSPPVSCKINKINVPTKLSSSAGRKRAAGQLKKRKK